MSVRLRTILVGTAAPFALVVPILAQSPGQNPVRPIRVTDRIAVLTGAGANIGVSIGEDGILLIDNGVAQMSANVKAALASLDPRPVRLALNTNWHYDHADNNGVFAAAGAVVMAHPNSRPPMRTEQRIPEIVPTTVVPPYPPAAWPMVCITEPATLHVNGDEIVVLHVPAAHSNGDLAYYFRRANILFTGDLFFSGSIPFVHFTGGGTVAGMIRAADRFLAETNDQTRIVPGHGPVSTRAEVRVARDLLATIRDRVQALLDAGRTPDEVATANPLVDLYKGQRSAVAPDRFARLVAEDLQKAAKR